MILLTVNLFMSTIEMIILHVRINNSHVCMIMLHVDTIHHACWGQRYPTIEKLAIQC